MCITPNQRGVTLIRKEKIVVKEISCNKHKGNLLEENEEEIFVQRHKPPRGDFELK